MMDNSPTETKPVAATQLPASLPAERLRPTCRADSLGFQTTDQLASGQQVTGQQVTGQQATGQLTGDKLTTGQQTARSLPVVQTRALEAIRFGSSIQRPGYNIFALGAQRTGRHRTVLSVIEDKAAQAAAPGDWVYVHNFASPYKPSAICLPAGIARPFADAMAEMIDDLRSAIPAAFQADDYRDKQRAIDGEFEKAQEQGFEKIRVEAESKDITVMRTPMGFSFAPIIDGKVATPETFGKLSKEDQTVFEQTMQRLQKELATFLEQVPELQKNHRDRSRALTAEVTATVVDAAIKVIADRFIGITAINKRLAEVREDLIANSAIFVTPPGGQEGPVSDETAMVSGMDPRFNRYLVNVMIDNDSDGDRMGAPVVTEDHPTLSNLVGRIEHIAHFGALTTDFTMIRSGALHLANGGFLVLDARKLLSEMFSWEALKRALHSGRIVIAAAADQLGLTATVSLQPEPIPLQVKVVLVGDRILYYLLSSLDPEFSELFKVQADFDEELARTDDNIQLYTQLIVSIIEKEELQPMDAQAVAVVLDEVTRIARDAERLSLKTGSLTDLLYEADFWATQANEPVTSAVHVKSALNAQIKRSDRLRTLSHDMIERGTILIDTVGKTVGQINGLSVVSFGDNRFGQPSRITVRTRMGAGDVVDIERETKLGGALHSKGVLILSSYLAATFSPKTPLSVHASIVFEQSYGGVDGDSASSTELYALLSALSEVPINQSFAVTGSVNQFGQVQAIGGVNDKIEGFFDVCNRQGLTGDQGVLIPESNIKHLVLRQDVVDAVAAGRFSIYPVSHINQGIELLTGVAAGERQSDGRFPPGTINALVEERLEAYAQARKAYGVDTGDKVSANKTTAATDAGTRDKNGDDSSDDSDDNQSNDKGSTRSHNANGPIQKVSIASAGNDKQKADSSAGTADRSQVPS